MRAGTNRNLRPLDLIEPADEPRAGAKAFNCARLKQAGFRVPDGLVVLATATDDDVRAVGEDAWFDGLPAGETFAVRSSGIGEDGAGESFAGIHQTILGVGSDGLASAVDACRRSAHSIQALEYRRARRVTTDGIAMAVLIQRMVHPRASGVAFTVNPVTGAGDEVVINSSWGLGEALVSGTIDPDEFVVDKKDGALRWSRIGEKGTPDRADAWSLTPDQAGELADLLLGIERHYGAPQDVEWCHDGAGFWIVQSRPVTTARARAGETEWTRANIGEVLPDLTSPQALDVFEVLLNRAERQYGGRLMAPDDELGPVVKSFCGRLYFNLSQFRHMCAVGGLPPAMMLRSMGHAGAIHLEDERKPRLTLKTLRCLPDFARMAWQHFRAADMIRRHDAKTREYLERLDADPRARSDEEIWSGFDRWFAEAPDYMQTVLLLGNVMFHEAPVRTICEKVGFPFERLVYPQLARGERSVSGQQAFDLVALAAVARREPAVVRLFSNGVPDPARMRAALEGTSFLEGFDRFLEKYGHRGRYEYDWALPRYREDPGPLLHALRTHIEAGARTEENDRPEAKEREAADAWGAFERRLSAWQRLTILPRVRKSIRTIKQYYVWRERVRSDVVRLLGRLRDWHLALADRFVERGRLAARDDYFLLRFEEIASVVRGRLEPGALAAIVADRRQEQDRFRQVQMPLLMRASELPALVRMAGVSGGSADERELTGLPVSDGCVEAEVVVVRDPADFARMTRGAILVAPATDPSWTPLFTLASGVIVEVGGVLSHASTIAREYGLPALANVKHATRRLRTGERVRLDATHGVVRKLENTHAIPGDAEPVSTRLTPTQIAQV